MPKIAARVSGLSESITLAIDAKAKAMKAAGEDVVNFGAGEPDFDTPDQVKLAAKAALDKGATKYVASAGLPELKTALAGKLKSENGLDYTPAQILVSVGAKHSLFNVISTVVERGDEVIIPAPYWVSYFDMVKFAEGVPVIVDCPAGQDFKMTPAQLRAAITPRTRLVIVNSPSNPTGSVYSEAELKALAEVIVEKDILAISDEIYEKLVYGDARHVSLAGLPGMMERTLTVNGFSKAFSMTGWRLGYTAGPASIIGPMAVLQSHSTSNATTFAQWGAVEAIHSANADAERMRLAFAERQAFIVKRLNAIDGVTCNTPQGAFYAFPDMSAFHGRATPDGKTIGGSMDLAEYVLTQAKVGIVPGIAFGADRHQRLSYATSLANLEKGLDRMEAALRLLR